MEIKAKIAIIICLLTGFYLPVMAESSPWHDVKLLAAKDAIASDTTTLELIANSSYEKARFLNLDFDLMALKLRSPKLAGRSLDQKQKHTPLSIALPLPNGRLIRVILTKNNLLPSSFLRRYPQLKMFNIIPDAHIASGKVDMTPYGFHALLQTRQGETIFIDPVNNDIYASYKKSDQIKDSNSVFSCSAHSEGPILQSSNKSSKQLESINSSERTQKSLINYRIAVAATGEYTAKHGGTVDSAMSAIATTINRVNQVFEQDLGIHLSLVLNNDQLIYLDADTDPYSATNSKDLVYQNQTNIDSIIGSENYDIGHLFSISGGGLAAISSACSTGRKAEGISGISNPQNDSFNLDFVAHELGHQFGATHTFNGVEGLCSGNTRSANTAFEPGSGSTIMSYAGYCSSDNLQKNTDAMFHIGSIQQIRAYVESDAIKGCGVNNNISNASPRVDAGENHVIPANTPFELVGNATDVDGDNLIFSWQELDAGELSPVNTDRGNNAIFRVHPLTNKKSRIFPPLRYLLSHSSVRGENLPIQQRLLKFRLVVQDSHNTTQSDAMSILVKRTGSRFALNLPRSQYTLGETYKVLWNVANTDVAPVNCSNVNISMSVDGGYHFNYKLGTNLPNTGEAWVTIPSSVPLTLRGRFKISCSDNIFFAVSYRNFVVNNQDHSKRQILSDEDQSEPNLDDIDLSALDDTKITQASGTESGGGSMGWLFSLMFIFVIRRFKIKC